MYLLTIIQEIQCKNFTRFNELIALFNPLIYSWLGKIKVPYDEREDYLSHAKIVLMECAIHYDVNRNVPFESYFKIKLYHFYGNHISKKQIQTLSLVNESLYDEMVTVDFDTSLEKEERIQMLLALDHHLTNQESYILHALLHGDTILQISKTLGITTKTVLNKKYKIISKMKQLLGTSSD